MNVLVYSGPEVIQISLAHTLSILRSLLFPHYSVQTISPKALNSHPWAPTCALLVFPGCTGQIISVRSTGVNEYLQRGGNFLGLGFTARCETRPHNAETPSLNFFDVSSKSSIFPSPIPEDGIKPHFSALKLSSGITAKYVYCGGPSLTFVGMANVSSASVVATYPDGSTAAAVFKIKEGRAMLWGPRFEYPINEEPAISIISTEIGGHEAVLLIEQQRKQAFSKVLVDLGLKVAGSNIVPYMTPLQQHLVSDPSKPDAVSQIRDALSLPPSGLFEDSNDTFIITESAEGTSTLLQGTTKTPKHITLWTESRLPDPKLTPSFDLSRYFHLLNTARLFEGFSSDRDRWGAGEVLLYGEVVTSTQTMLDKYDFPA